jgi:hypothetical protein
MANMSSGEAHTKKGLRDVLIPCGMSSGIQAFFMESFVTNHVHPLFGRQVELKEAAPVQGL